MTESKSKKVLKKFLYVFVICAILTGSVLRLGHGNADMSTQIKMDMDPYRIDLLTMRLPFKYGRASIWRAIKENQISADELEKLNFALPGDSGFNAASKFSVVRMLKAERDIDDERVGYYGNQETLDALTTAKGTKLFFNLIHFEGRNLGGNIEQADILYAILSRIDPKWCAAAKGESIKTIEVSNTTLAPDHHKVIRLPDSFRPWTKNIGNSWPLVCVYGDDGEKYLFINLFVRMKNAGETQWRY